MSGDFSDLTSGGQVFYGGLIGGIVGALVGSHISGAMHEFAKYCEAVVPAIPVGHAFGRIGCFLAGCCYGAPYTGACSVSFPKAGIDYSVFPIQILEAALNIGIFLLLIFSERRKHQAFYSVYLYIISYSAIRFALEFFRGDEIRGIAQGISTSQWISIGLFFVGATLLLRNIVREKNCSQG